VGVVCAVNIFLALFVGIVEVLSIPNVTLDRMVGFIHDYGKQTDNSRLLDFSVHKSVYDTGMLGGLLLSAIPFYISFSGSRMQI
jgi:hypothetical protein